MGSYISTIDCCLTFVVSNLNFDIYKKPEGYYRPAQNAGRFAQQQKLEDEFQSQGLGFGTLISKRSVAAQPVTFFTSHANHAALTALAQNNAHQEQQFHTKREVYEKP